MNKSELKNIIKECVREILSEGVVSEFSNDRKRSYPSSESRVFDIIANAVEKNGKQVQHPDPSKLDTVGYVFKNLMLLVKKDGSSKTIQVDNLFATKDENGQVDYVSGTPSDLKKIAKDNIQELKEINGTPEYSHENYGMLEAEGVDSELMRYTVSYKLYKNGAAIRNRKNVEVYGPDFGTAELDKKKFLEDKVYSLEIASAESMKGKNKEIEPIVKPTVSDGELKIVGLVVTSMQQTPKPAKMGPAFDAETVKKLSAPMAPGSTVD